MTIGYTDEQWDQLHQDYLEDHQPNRTTPTTLAQLVSLQLELIQAQKVAIRNGDTEGAATAAQMRLEAHVRAKELGR